MESRSTTKTVKIECSGRIQAVQPRIRLMRSFDERSHSYLGYVLRVEGTLSYESGEFKTTLGKAAQAKHQFRVGMEVSVLAVPVPDPRLETAVFYKASCLKILKYAEGDPPFVPPFHGVPPDLETYRSRGHRRLAARTYESKCSTCILVAGCQCRPPSLTGFHPQKNTASEISATVRKYAHSTAQALHATCQGAAA